MLKTENGPTLPTAGLAKTQSAPCPARIPAPNTTFDFFRKIGRKIGPDKSQLDNGKDTDAIENVRAEWQSEKFGHRTC